MTGKEFEAEIQKLDPRFTVIENANRPGLSNIFFDGNNCDLPVVSTHNIKPEIDNGYRYEFPNGMRPRFWSQGEVKDRLIKFLAEYKKEDYEGKED